MNSVHKKIAEAISKFKARTDSRWWDEFALEIADIYEEEWRKEVTKRWGLKFPQSIDAEVEGERILFLETAGCEE